MNVSEGENFLPKIRSLFVIFLSDLRFPIYASKKKFRGNESSKPSEVLKPEVTYFTMEKEKGYFPILSHSRGKIVFLFFLFQFINVEFLCPARLRWVNFSSFEFYEKGSDTRIQSRGFFRRSKEARKEGGGC